MTIVPYFILVVKWIAKSSRFASRSCGHSRQDPLASPVSLTKFWIGFVEHLMPASLKRELEPQIRAIQFVKDDTFFAPTKLGNPKSFSGMSALFGQVKQDYRFASQTQQPTTPNATGLQQPSTNQTPPMLKSNTGELSTNQVRVGWRANL